MPPAHIPVHPACMHLPGKVTGSETEDVPVTGVRCEDVVIQDAAEIEAGIETALSADSLEEKSGSTGTLERRVPRLLEIVGNK